VAPAVRRLGGLFIAVLGGLVSWLAHSLAQREGLLIKAGLLGPAFFIIGLGLILFPGYREERMTRGEDISKLRGYALITPRWWAILMLGLVLSGLDWIAMVSGWW